MWTIGIEGELSVCLGGTWRLLPIITWYSISSAEGGNVVVVEGGRVCNGRQQHTVGWILYKPMATIVNKHRQGTLDYNMIHSYWINNNIQSRVH